MHALHVDLYFEEELVSNNANTNSDSYSNLNPTICLVLNYNDFLVGSSYFKLEEIQVYSVVENIYYSS